MSIWAELKRVVNDNFNYPLNKQNFYPTNFGVNAEWFEVSTTYTAPQTGVYIVTCVGKGGDGDATMGEPGTGYQEYGGSNNNWSNCYASSGGGGAVCKGYVFLQAGQTVSITVNSSQSSFGNLISAGAGQPGSLNWNGTVSVPAGGSILIAGNIVNHAGYPGTVAQPGATSIVGGNAGLITPWSLNDGWSQGYLPFINWTEITGGEGADRNEGGHGSNGLPGKFGGGYGAGTRSRMTGVRGGGGYGAGGNRDRAEQPSSSTYRYSSFSFGGKGVVIVEHGTMIYG